MIKQLSGINDDALIAGVAGDVVSSYNALDTAVTNLQNQTGDIEAINAATTDLSDAGVAFSNGLTSAADLFDTVETGVTRVEGSFAQGSLVLNGPTEGPLDGFKSDATINGEDYSNYSDYVSSFVTGE